MKQLIFLMLLTISFFACAESDTEVFSGLEARDFRFKVFLDDRLMGSHHVEVRPDGDLVRVSIRADFKVRFLFITAFEYLHRVEEVWQDGCLNTISGSTDNNGEALFIDGKRESEKVFKLKSHQGQTELEGCVRSFAYWHKPLLQADALLNMQTANYEPATFTYLNRDTLVMNEKPFTADQYLLNADGKKVYLWYTPEGQWIALESETENGYKVRYFSEVAY